MKTVEIHVFTEVVIRNCCFKPRSDEENAFYATPLLLDGYAIVPRDEYENHMEHTKQTSCKGGLYSVSGKDIGELMDVLKQHAHSNDSPADTIRRILHELKEAREWDGIGPR